MQADILDGRPHNRQATGFCREHVNLISALPHIAEETFNGVGGLNVPMHRGRKLVKRQRLVFLLGQASHRFWIAFAIFGFEGLQLDHCLLFAGLLPNPNEFGGNFSALASGDRIEDVALFMHQTALTRCGRKELRDSRKPPIMPIRHDQIDVGCSSGTQILRASKPIHLCPLRRRLAGLTPLCFPPDRRLRPLK